jgi:hypothetical protein
MQHSFNLQNQHNGMPSYANSDRQRKTFKKIYDLLPSPSVFFKCVLRGWILSWYRNYFHSVISESGYF